jgi:hypothetical protein
VYYHNAVHRAHSRHLPRRHLRRTEVQDISIAKIVWRSLVGGVVAVMAAEDGHVRRDEQEVYGDHEQIWYVAQSPR